MNQIEELNQTALFAQRFFVNRWRGSRVSRLEHVQDNLNVFTPTLAIMLSNAVRTVDVMMTLFPYQDGLNPGARKDIVQSVEASKNQIHNHPVVAELILYPQYLIHAGLMTLFLDAVTGLATHDGYQCIPVQDYLQDKIIESNIDLTLEDIGTKPWYKALDSLKKSFN